MDVALLLILVFIFCCITGIVIVNVVILSKQKNDDIPHMIIYTGLIFLTIFFGLGSFYLIGKLVMYETDSGLDGLSRGISLLSGALILASLCCVGYYSVDKYRKNMLSWEKQFFIMTNIFFGILGVFGFGLTQ